MSQDLDALYGTRQPPAVLRPLRAGPLSLLVADGELRSICWHGTELLRGISYPVRDANWGSMSPETRDEAFEEAPGSFTYRRVFSVGGDRLQGRFELNGRADGHLSARVAFVAAEAIRVNRAGFTLLHPILDIAGTPLEIEHGDGTREETSFPQAISPTQPARDIRGLAYGRGGIRIRIAFSGEVFEMEDQRNWTDASYKTYCRPLALPYPYELAANVPVEQAIELDFEGEAAGRAAMAARPLALGAVCGRVPEMALAVEPGWTSTPAPATGPLAGMRHIVRLDLTGADALAGADMLRDRAGPLDLEIVTTDDAERLPDDLARLAEALARLGAKPDHVLALPRAYLKSYQPDGAWPQGATPADAIRTARAAFPEARIGGGMLSNFTEVNRCPPPVELVDFMGFGTTAIVHAADDRSVLETLEALPQVFASAGALAPGKPCRLGLVSIGMRSNPYGAEVAANPDGQRRAMAMRDPRHGALFGAAWMVGAVAATEGSMVESMALGAPAGPFGFAADDEARHLTPGLHVVRALAAMAGRERLGVVALQPALRCVAARGDDGEVQLVMANCSSDPLTVELPMMASLKVLDERALAAAQRDEEWLDTGSETRQSLELGPFAVAFARLPAEKEPTR